MPVRQEPQERGRDTARDDVAGEVVARLADPRTLAAAIDVSARQTTFTDFVRWRPHTVAGGYAGTAVLFGAADARWPGQGWDEVGHRHLEQAVAAMPSTPRVDTSLFSGLAGIGFAAQVLAAGRDRYRRLLTTVDGELCPRVTEAVAVVRGDAAGPVSVFDLISGLTGVGVYLLARRHAGSGSAATEALEALLAGLGQLLADDGDLPRWHTPVPFLSPAMRSAYPHGNLNCGLAHGLPGPVALLALAILDGVEVDGVADGLAAAARWLADARVERADGPDWPNAVGLPPEDGPRRGSASVPPRDTAVAPPGAGRAGRAAWCYGSPGVARSLWLAGEALDDAALRDLAVRAMCAVVARPPDARLLTTPSFCHGTAGLLRLVDAFARDTSLPELVTASESLVAELAAAYDPTSVLGYRDVEASGMAVDQPTLLDGAAGVALALLGTCGAAPWERLFLLS